MEGPGHLPSRPREYVDLVSDDEGEDDAGLVDVNQPPPQGHFPELNDLVLLDNLAAHERAVWDALDLEAGRLPAPILGDWRDDFPGPEAERIIPPVAGFPIAGGPQMFDQAEWLDFDPQPVNSVNNQARNQAGHKADKAKMDNDNDLIQNEISNQLNNELSDNESNFFRELSRQFHDGRMDNDDDDDAFVWKRVNQVRHNANNTIDRDPPSANEMDNKARCLEGVVNIFPDICLDYISQLYTALEGKKTVTALVELVLEREENGEPYPKLNQLKRKRQPVESDLEEEIKRKYTSNPAHSSDKYLTLTRGMLAEEFPSIPMTFIMRHFYNAHMVLYTAYQDIAEAQRLWDPNNPSYNKLKQPRKAKTYLPHLVDGKLADPATPEDQKRAYLELKDVRVGRTNWETKLAAKTQREAEEAAAKKKYEDDEAANLEQAKRENTMEECGCCYDDFPRNRMIHCNNDSITHFFCKRCARLHAETQIGSAKYELQCMSTDVCNAGYSHAQRQIFLDDNLTTALDRIEAETVLRLAGIENLASCPFCSYAAEYPPIEQERLFHCQRETCAKTSCRLCQKESHIPKTCKENAKDIGLDVRREVEEAMTKAMVRLCNKCKGPFIKEDGCNKMNCPCGNIQCYVCSKSCQYNHFDDERRGGKAGNCPLFDDVNKRHEEETKRAEEEVVEKLRREHPEVAPEDLEIKVSDTVKADEARRRQKHHHIPAADRFLLNPGRVFAGGDIPGAFLPGGPAQFRLHAGNPNQGWDLFPGPYMGGDHMNRAGQPDQGQQQPPPNLQG
ncbi:hypothetical protein O988_03675 [Pseudogymnoascus sp. VKM F-3808]|nr:hypothetical protein O988_03675 [Pseudogymnoascus sp. VKM F-3808]